MKRINANEYACSYAASNATVKIFVNQQKLTTVIGKESIKCPFNGRHIDCKIFKYFKYFWAVSTMFNSSKNVIVLLNIAESKETMLTFC